jgi:hypothetical protein
MTIVALVAQYFPKPAKYFKIMPIYSTYISTSFCSKNYNIEPNFSDLKKGQK